MSTPAPDGASATNGDILDWLHEQGKQRGARVPDFDIEKVLSVVRAARKSDIRAGYAARGGNAAHAGGPTALRIMLGSRLRRLRESAGITRKDAGARIRASGSKISRMELGRVPLKERDVTGLIELYGVTDPAQRDSLLRLTHEATDPAWASYRDTVPDWFDAYVGLEEAAQLIRTYEIQFVPGLLQTEEYARAVMLEGAPDLGPGEIEQRVAALMRRQKLLGKADPPWLWAIVDEAALRRPIGSRHVLATQIRRLIDAVREFHITLQVVPFPQGGHAAPGGSFTIMRFREADVDDVVFVQHPSGAVYLDKPDEVQQYMAVMERLSLAGTTPDRTMEILSAMLEEI